MDAPVGGCLTTKLRRSGVSTAIRTVLTDVQQGKQCDTGGELVHYYSSLCGWGMPSWHAEESSQRYAVRTPGSCYATMP